MAEVVDSIIAELIVKGIDQYEASMGRLRRAHEGVLPSMKALGDQSLVIEQAAQRYKGGTDRIVQAEEQATQRVNRTRKARIDAAADEAAATEQSARRQKAAIKDVADYVDRYMKGQGRGNSAFDKEFQQYAANNAAAIEKEFQRRQQQEQARQRRPFIRDTTVPQTDPATSRIGRTVPREGTGQRSIPAAVLNGAGDEALVAEEAEINRLAVDRIALQSSLNTLRGASRREVQDEIAALRLQEQLLAKQVPLEETLLQVERLRAAQQARNAEEQALASRKGGARNAEQFARGAGFYQATGGSFAIAGIAASAIAGGVAAAAKTGIDYANDLAVTSKQLGLTTRDLQVYQSAAERVGVTTEQLRTAFSDLSNNIGRAKEGAEEQSKIFGKDGLNIDLTRKGYETLSGILPTIVQRFSAIQDPAKRAALETALFGETGRKLDSLLSGGTGSIKALGDELARTGGILSGEDIARSAKVAADLKKLGDQLERQLASTVSQNAAAIETLATSLLNGATALLKFIDAFERFRAQNKTTSGDPGLAAEGRSTLNQTPEGRQQQRRDIAAGLSAIREGERNGGAFINVQNGIGTPGLLGGSYIPNTAEARNAAKQELLSRRRQTNAIERSTAAENGSGGQPPQDGSPGNLNVFAPRGRKGPDLQKLAEEQQKRFQDELAQIQAQTLAAKREQLVGDEAQLKADQAALKASHDKTILDIKAQVKLKQITAAHGEELKTAEDTAYDEKTRALNLKAAIRQDQAAFQADQDSLTAQIQRTQAEEALATTTDQRRRLALQVLALEEQRSRGGYENTINSKSPDVTDGDRDRARDRLAELPRDTQQQREIINTQNAHPLDAYRQRLHQATDSTKDALQQVEVNALSRLEDQIAGTVGKVLGLKGAFGELASSIISDLARIEIERAILGATGGSGGGGFGGFLASLLGKGGGASAGGGINNLGGFSFASGGLAGVDTSLPGFANGGSATIGGNPGIDQNTLSINGQPVLRVGQGEQLTVTPQNRAIAPNNTAITAPGAGSSTIIHAPQFNLSGAVVTPQLYAEMEQITKRGIAAAAPAIARAGAIGSQAVYRTASQLGPVNR